VSSLAKKKIGKGQGVQRDEKSRIEDRRFRGPNNSLELWGQI